MDKINQSFYSANFLSPVFNLPTNGHNLFQQFNNFIQVKGISSRNLSVNFLQKYLTLRSINLFLQYMYEINIIIIIRGIFVRTSQNHTKWFSNKIFRWLSKILYGTHCDEKKTIKLSFSIGFIIREPQYFD